VFFKFVIIVLAKLFLNFKESIVMENFIDVAISLIPSLLVIVFILFLIRTYILVKKYLDVKTEYYQYKLKEIKKNGE
jgi:hypothetical protein